MNEYIAGALRQGAGGLRVFAGFDGCVDQIVRVDGLTTMQGFGGHILRKAGKSCSVKTVLQDERAGGNMPILSRALSALGVGVCCAGALGYPEVSPVFKEALGGCELLSVSGCGLSTCLEFLDGKIMMYQNAEMDRLDYRLLTQRVPEKKLVELMEASDMLVFLNWSEMALSADIWNGFAKNLLPKLNKTVPLLVDISDCSARSRQEAQGLIKTLKLFAARLPLYLSLNRNEAEQLSVKLNTGHTSPEKISGRLRKTIGAQAVVVHLTDSCCYDAHGGRGFIAKRVIEKPRLLTGGGDNFNAGLAYGLLLGLDIENALRTANAVSGYYVANGQSPSMEELAEHFDFFIDTDSA